MSTSSSSDADRLLRQALLALETNRPLDALAGFDQVLARQPALAAAMDGRAQALRRLGRLHEAVDWYGRALEASPDFAEALVHRARCHQEMGEDVLALADFQRALRLQPQRHDWHLACATLLATDDPTAAKAALQEAARCGAAPAQVDFMLAALTGAPPPPLPPSSYVSALFDAYAPHFERHLTRKLHYRAPQLLADVLLPLLAGRRGRIADLGCGTGLMGRLLRGQASELEGVDLSPAMIEQAKACGVYDALDVGDLVAFLRARSDHYDIAVAADVFVYIGDLAPVFAALKQALRIEGMTAFTVEALDEGDFVLQPTRRYAHSRAYIERVAAAHGFASRGITRRTLRMNGDAEVAGYVCVFARRRERR